MTRTQKGAHGIIFSTLWKGFLLMHNQPPVFQTLSLLVLLPEIVLLGFTVVLSFVKVHRSLQCNAEMSFAVFKSGCRSLFEVVVHATQQILGNL